MRYLLDTHAFLWALTYPKKLPRPVLRVLEDQKNELFLSAVSIWEASIKYRAGRLLLGGKSPSDLLDEADDMGVRLISLEPEEAASHSNLTEDTHFDPFDRII